MFFDEPELFRAVGTFCDDFRQVTDAEVTELLGRAISSRWTG
jgi:predicted phosphoribosyltransferase